MSKKIIKTQRVWFLRMKGWGDLHHLQRLTWLVKRTKERTTEQCSYCPKKQCSCQLLGSSENRSFQRCRSSVRVYCKMGVNRFFVLAKTSENCIYIGSSKANDKPNLMEGQVKIWLILNKEFLVFLTGVLNF